MIVAEIEMAGEREHVDHSLECLAIGIGVLQQITHRNQFGLESLERDHVVPTEVETV